MRLLNLNKIYLFFIFFVLMYPVHAEENVDIWKKDNAQKKSDLKVKDPQNTNTKIKINNNSVTIDQVKIEVKNNLEDAKESTNLYGIYDPEEHNFNLNMWSRSEGTQVKDTIDRISKIRLSNFSEEVFISTLFTNSYLPLNNMTEEEFLNYKFNWLIKNEKDELIETFLNKNKNFPHKSKVIKYLVDKNISKANLDEACNKITFVNKDIKDPYLEKFKIVCLIKDNKKNEAQLMLDLIREQKVSDKFFDSKIDFLLGINEKKENKILDNNLLNFYLSSITVKDFKYVPNKKTDKFIWKYLSASNLLKIDNIDNKEQIYDLELAANNEKLKKSEIFEIYKNVPFTLSDYLRADDMYQTLDSLDSRSLIFQKYLLADNVESKLKYLFLLKDLFKKANLNNVYKEYLSNQLKILNSDEIPAKYIDLVDENIISEKKYEVEKIKYNDQNYHTSKIVKYYTEKSISKKNVEKELKNVHKKIKKNKKYKISLKDVALFEALAKDEIVVPAEIKYGEIAKNNLPPKELLNFLKNKEIGLLTLRIVELIGEDEITDFDEQSIYFINHLFNKAGLKRYRNKVLFAALPKRD